jgi:hypothetical protein
LSLLKIHNGYTFYFEKLFVKNQKLGKYVRKKKLEVNVEKMKMMVFNKRKRKSEENEWNWEGKKMEQLNEFKSRK